MPTFYERPFIGQNFKRIQNNVHVEYVQCTYMKDLGGRFVRDGKEVVDWIAVIGNPITGDYRIDPRQQIGSGDWYPVPEEENAARFGPGYLFLAERAERAEEALALLVERILALESAPKEDPSTKHDEALTRLTDTPRRQRGTAPAATP